MSRFTAKLANGRSIAWGYDRPLQEYFLQEFYSESEVKAMEEGAMEAPSQYAMDSECYYSIGSHCTTQPHPDQPTKMDWSNGEILELMQQYGELIPEEHRDAIALDNPF